MDNDNLLHALKDLGVEILDLSARVSVLERKIERSSSVIDTICDCPNCDGLCSHDM